MPLSSESASPAAPSESSSTDWELESFVDFLPKALVFAKTIIWLQADPKDETTVERLRGGGYNRIIGLTLTHSQTQDGEAPDSQHIQAQASEAAVEYILRIPREDWTKVDDDVAAHVFVDRLANQDSEIPKIPIPKVIRFDWTTNNCLGSQFMVQTRLRGQSLLDVYPGLSHEHQCKVARELGQVLRRMIAVSSTQPGKLVFPDMDRTLDAEIHVAAWEDPEQGRYLPSDEQRKARRSSPYLPGPATESVLDILLRTFQTRMEKTEPKDGWAANRLDQFCAMASELNESGYFKNFDGHFTLAHLDLEPRNILVDPDSALECPIITGILDGDSAILAPAFMSCAPPMWIWHWTGDEDGDEQLASEEPPTHELRELKTEFEASAGNGYMQCAYHPAYRLARRLLRLAIYNEHDKEDIEQSDKMLEDWQQLFHGNAATSTATQDVEVRSQPTDCAVVVREAEETDVHGSNIANGDTGLPQTDNPLSPFVDRYLASQSDARGAGDG